MSLPMSRQCGNPGETCGMLTISASGFCQRHDPQQAAIRSQQARQAARKSHEWRPDPEITAWAESLDFSTPEGRAQGLTETARLVAQGGLSVGQGQAIAALARAVEPKAKKPTNQPSVLVIETPGLTNGHELGTTPDRSANA